MKNISIVIITKNEEKYIEECLKCVSGYGFEIVVVDTGSVDGTIEKAKLYTDKIYSFQWIDDFSAARNYAANKATNEYILMLDSDEFAYDLEKELILKSVNENPESVGRIFRQNKLDGENLGISGRERISRVYSKKLFHFVGRIHEQIVSKDGNSHQTYNVPFYCTHVGYQGTEEEKRNKADRNIKLLEKSMEENGENPYDLYQLGKGYFFRQDYLEAIKYFSKGFAYDLNPQMEYVVDMVVTYGYAMINSGNAIAAMELEGIYDAFKYSADYLFVLGLIYMQNAEFDKAIFNFKEATKKEVAVVEGVNSFSANYNIGVIFECMGNKEQAIYFYQKCGTYEKAITRLKECK